MITFHDDGLPDGYRIKQVEFSWSVRTPRRSHWRNFWHPGTLKLSP